VLEETGPKEKKAARGREAARKGLIQRDWEENDRGL